MKNTKRAWIFSVFALVLCVSLLVGSTYAWFTDTATTGVSKIQAGTLEVDLVDADGNTLVGKTLAFQKAAGAENEPVLWEPGCKYELAPVYVKNAGNLALKYQIIVNGLDGDSELLKVIDFKMVDVSGATVDLDAFEGHLAANETSAALTLIGEMDTEAGNEYQGKTLSGLGITVIATQDTVENDTYGDQYDKDAKYPAKVANTQELKDALAAGENVILADDIDLTESVVIPADKTVKLNLNGKTLNAPENGLCAIQNEGTLIIDGEGTMTGTYTALYSNGNLTVNGGDFSANGNFGLLIDNIYGTETSVAVINGGTFSGVGVYNPTELTVNGGTFNKGSDPDGAQSDLSLFVSPTFVGVPNTASVTLNGGTFNGDIYVYDDGITETTFVNNGATINGVVKDNS